MRTLFEILQSLGAIGGIVGLGWFMGMIIGFSIEGKVTVWLVVGPLAASVLSLAIGAILEVVYNAGINSTIKEEESE